MNPRQAMTRKKVQLLATALAVVLALAASMIVRQWGGFDSVANARPEISQAATVPASIDPNLAVQGSGFIAVQLPDRSGAVGYTRVGPLKANECGDLVVGAGEGHELSPPVNAGGDSNEVTIEDDGSVYVQRSDSRVTVGQLRLTQFDHPELLTPIGNGIFTANSRSGAARNSHPGEDGAGNVPDGFLKQQTKVANWQRQERK
jgi:flagellar basal body rod protein FlgG